MEEQSLSFSLSQGSERSAKSTAKKGAGATPVDLWMHERGCLQRGFSFVAGVDEAGRGPLAGPVVACCASLPQEFNIGEINDSKQLTAAVRDRIYDRIISDGISFGIGIVHSDEIDRINILQATYAAMRLSVAALPQPPDFLLIDGLPVPNLFGCMQLAIVSGDSLSVSIAAASIIAKVTRDRMMRNYSVQYPEYGFHQHKGYGSAMHLAALRRHGPCPIHRRSFSPVSELLEPTLL